MPDHLDLYQKKHGGTYFTGWYTVECFFKPYFNVYLCLLQDILVYVTQNVEPSPASMKEIIQCAGGQVS